MPENKNHPRGPDVAALTPIPESERSRSEASHGVVSESGRSSSDSTMILEKTLSSSGQDAWAPALTERSSSGQSPPAFYPNEIVAGRYRIARFMGRGGMGEVYAADDIELGERVALKALSSEVAADPKVIERLKQEIHLARKVTHPNVCRTLEFGYHDSVNPEGVKTKTAYLTMEFLAGETLAKRLERVGRLSTPQALPLVSQVAAALVAAHKAGVVHRDLKPGNILLVLSEDGETRAVVTDFGLAGRASGRESFAASSAGGKEVSGTWAYMAPEQVLGEDPSPAADIYALGVVMFEAVTGTLPFEGDTPLATAFKRLNEPPPSPRERLPELSAKWEMIILRCLERDPAERFQGAAELARALSGEQPVLGRLSTAKDKTKRFSHWLMAGAAALLVLAVVSTLGYRFQASKREVQPKLTTQTAPKQVSGVGESIATSHGSQRRAESETRMASSELKGGPPMTATSSDRLKAAQAGHDGAAQGAKLLTAQAQRLEQQGEQVGAERKYEEALAIQREIQDKTGAAATLTMLADLKAGQYDFAAAHSRLEEALAIELQIGDQRAVTVSLNKSALFHYEQGELPASRRLYEQALERARGAASRDLTVDILTGLGTVMTLQGDLSVARTRLEEALSIADRQGDKIANAKTRLVLARLCLMELKPSEAESLARAAAKEFDTRDITGAEALAESVLASALLAQGKLSESLEVAGRASDLAQKSRDKRLDIRVSTIAAQAKGATARESEWDEVSESLLELTSAAKKIAFLEGELEARLALGELEMSWGRAPAGRSRLVAVEKKAEANGFKLIAQEAAAARKKKV